MNSNARKQVYISSLVIALMLGLFISNMAMALGKTPSNQEVKKPVEPLPSIGSMENFKQLLSEYENQFAANHIYITDDFATNSIGDLSRVAMPQSINKEMAGAAADSSQTNVQVAGVDEADIVKTDGNYIYQINSENVVIIQALPANHMQVTAKIDFGMANFTPQEIFLDNKYLVVIGHNNPEIYAKESARSIRPGIYPPFKHYQPTTLALIYNIEAKNNIHKVREIELQGDYLSARKIGSSLYLVSRAYLDYYSASENDEITLPTMRDSLSNNDFEIIDCAKINYFPEEIFPAYIMIAGLDLDKEEKANVTTILGNGENIYASLNHLYIAVTREDTSRPLLRDSSFPNSVSERQTSIYSFALAEGKINYQAKGRVPGHILNQFSMDESGGYFRIATTSGELWRDDDNTSKNNLYVLDNDLQMVGRLEGIAPGETIYSTRFMGDRAYMVTFRTVDPLFVIDLKEPSNPTILGKLKIPGYSDYLHPYDENHIIGFGKDTIEVKHGDNDVQAYYQGIKIALFDVSEVNNPRQIAAEIIGDRGTDSELLHNHKALLFSREKSLLAFPITVMSLSEEDKLKNPAGSPAYGSFAFQGAYVYSIDPQKGFALRGKISHLSESDYLKSGDFWYGSGKNVHRIIYINDTLYTLSPGLIKANQINNLKEIGFLSL